MDKSTFKNIINPIAFALSLFSGIFIQACAPSNGMSNTVKPRYHHTWYKKHTYKKKWHIGRLYLRPEKQGVRSVKVKN